MSTPHVIIIGGGIAGMSAGCYALRSGFKTTIIEHNLALGGVCTAWRRGSYMIDGCIHWLTGGPFDKVYEELGILPALKLNQLDTWTTYRNTRDGIEVPITRDLDALISRLVEISPKDGEELRQMREAASQLVHTRPSLEAADLVNLWDRLHSIWETRKTLGPIIRYRKPLGEWSREHLSSERLRRILTCFMPESSPAFVLLMFLGYMEQGYFSRPVGGTAAFRDALEKSYRGLGGEVILHATVDEILVEKNRAKGVRLADGTIHNADVVLSTSSAPETVLRLLGGRYDAEATRERLARWKLYDPIVIASFGVSRPYKEYPSLLVVDGIAPFDIGGRTNDHLYLRVCNDDPSYAPQGHSVVQTLLVTDYQWWATRGTDYNAEKDAVAQKALSHLAPYFPELRSAVEVTDIATPLTYWGMARSWRGAYEGWTPDPGSLSTRIKKTLEGLSGFYMAGQWVEPGGGVPTAALSGRQAVQLMCAQEKVPFCEAH